jgi:hypothetical protein
MNKREEPEMEAETAVAKSWRSFKMPFFAVSKSTMVACSICGFDDPSPEYFQSMRVPSGVIQSTVPLAYETKSCVEDATPSLAGGRASRAKGVSWSFTSLFSGAAKLAPSPTRSTKRTILHFDCVRESLSAAYVCLSAGASPFRRR